MDFLKSEFSGVPQGLTVALLKQLEATLRNARNLSTSDSARYELACIAICAQIKAILDLTGRVRAEMQETSVE